MGLSERLRQEILTCPLSFRAVSRATGIAVPIISRFASGKRSLNLESADRLAQYFGLELRKKSSRKKARAIPA